MTVPEPNRDDLFDADREVTPRPHDRLVAALMADEVLGCDERTAERFVEEHGTEVAEREIRGAWTATGFY
ncbi:hypothetical protein [Halosegnis marinus]|uniref:Uncharacterized protein n=1 Tax=Halosegnis marinus TaxID=3034023 RepID=A0ABD5ZRC3_9EURY|nr:hypothetical protein [Halosegnis sp. DT85]